MPYCLYLRKSRADVESESHGEGETLARHEKALLELAGRLHLNITEIYREIVSGDTIAARPVMQRLLSDVEQGVWEGVLVMEVERLARGNTIDQGIVAQTFQYSNTKIVTPIKTYDPSNEFDEEYFEFGLFMSRREYKIINRRLQRGRLASVKEGKFIGSIPPHGYRRVRVENGKGVRLEIDEEKAEAVRLIFELYTSGERLPDGTCARLGFTKIANRLNALRYPAPGKEWTAGSVRTVLLNPVYTGKIRWGRKRSVKKMVDGKVVEKRVISKDDYVLAEGLHSAIISDEVFAAAQEIMSKNPPRPVGENRRIKNPLAGLVFCGKCGRCMVRHAYTEKDMLVCPSPLCDNVSCKLSIVEERILIGLSEWMGGYAPDWSKVNQEEETQIEYKRSSLRRLEKNLASLEKQLDNVHDLLEKGVYSVEKFLERSRLLAAQIADAKKGIADIQAEISQEEARIKNRSVLIPNIERLLDAYPLLPDAQAKNEFLKDVLSKVLYTKERKPYRRGSAYDFKLILYPKFPEK